MSEKGENWGVTKNTSKIHEAKIRGLIENGEPEEIANFLLGTFNNAKVPEVKKPGQDTIKANISAEDRT